MIGLLLLGASAAADTQQLQRQLDFMVASCRAEAVVRLAAHSATDVTFEMARPGHLPTVSENEALQCALGKVRARTDLKLGFTGNEVRKK